MAVSLTQPPSPPLQSSISDIKVEANTRPLLLPTDSTDSVKRKPSRRANTAERRATHNAVERQRRETLNGRFLDLAGLLPNLSQIRRPSKSSIVNSSIAHVHASRRHRMLAARELRLLKLEADALRRELNEWRDRAGLPRVDEPARSEGFTAVLGGEIELEVVQEAEAEDQDDGDELDFGSYPAGEDVIAKNGPAPSLANTRTNSSNTTFTASPTTQLSSAINSNINNNTFAYNPTTNSPYTSHPGFSPEQEKMSGWNAQLFAALSAQAHGGHPSQQQQGGVPHHILPVYSQNPPQTHSLLPTPPATSHGQHNGQEMFGGRRERSGSLSTSGSSFGSPPTYDFEPLHPHGITIPDKRVLQIDTDMSNSGSFGASWQQSPVVSLSGGTGMGGLMYMMM